MAFTKITIMFLSFVMVMNIASITGFSNGEKGYSTFIKQDQKQSHTTYEVGDSQGWIIGNIDYNDWASSKKFQVNDILIFNYNNKYHNVMQVSKQEYDTCIVTKPIATYSTGKDSITLQATGDYYYICGFSGHCQIGQKLHIHVVAATESTSTQGIVKNPSPTSASSSSPFSFMWLMLLGFCFFLAF